MLENEKGRTLEKTFNLEEPSLEMMAHFKIDATCTNYNTNDTFYLKKTSKIERKGPLRPFATQAMLAQPLQKISTC
jgi:hypothetical protein